MQWCQKPNAKNSAPIVSRLKFSSSHVSFVSLATVLSLGTGPDPLHFRQKPSVFFTKQCTLSNLWEPARQNVTSLVLCSISVDENISLAFAVKLSFHWKVVKYSKSSNMNIVQYIQSFAHSCRRDFEGLSLVHQEPNKS